MKLIGLVGGSGAGKTTVSNVFLKHGAHVIDGDIVARKVVEKGKPALSEIEDAFGTGVLHSDGTLNRARLSEIVFRDENALHKLNTITHKYITEEIKKEIAESHASVVLIDAAALFESGIDALCDKVICVTANEEIRIKRIMARDGLTEKQAKDRIHAQKPDQFYIEKSDFHIVNDGSKEVLVKATEAILKEVCGETVF